MATITTDDGYAKLSPGSLLRWRGGESRERPVTADEWDDLLETEFGLVYGRD